jgi:hypothetical protein
MGLGKKRITVVTHHNLRYCYIVNLRGLFVFENDMIILDYELVEVRGIEDNAITVSINVLCKSSP